MSSRKAPPATLKPRFQISVRGNVGLGPGKAELLEHIRDTGSIVEAANRMGMSYMRAWTLVKTMNACFREPLVLTARGGRAQGGSQLSGTGILVLEIYRRMEREAQEATQSSWIALRNLLRD